MRKHLSTPPPPAAAAAPQKQGPKLGGLARRPVELKRGRGELLTILDCYLDGTISTADKRSRCPEERDVLALMEDITNEVIGRPKDAEAGRKEIKPKLQKTLNDMKSEVKNWREKADKVQLYNDKQQRMAEVKSLCHGGTPLLKLKAPPSTLGKGGHVGKIVEYLEMMRTWVQEETDPALGGLDICVDRLSFAAAVSLAGSNTAPQHSPSSAQHVSTALHVSSNYPPLYAGHPLSHLHARRVDWHDIGNAQRDQQGQD